MRRCMLDTNICIYIIKNKPEQARKRFKEYAIGDLAISSITVSELMYGANKSQYIEKNLKAVESFLLPFDIVDYDYKASLVYGEIRAGLERRGKVIGGLDMLIAAHAKSLDMILVTNNTREFDRVTGLDIDNWAV